MAVINIRRSSEYNNRARDYHLYLNDKKIGSIANGESKDFTIPSGGHKLVAKIDWCSSPEINFQINDAEEKKFITGGFKHGNWLMPAGGAVIAVHFILKYFFAINYTIFLVAPFFLTVVYYLTAGRKKYLTLSQV